MSSLGFRTTALEALQRQRLDGKRAIVTGANSGLGVETARALASAGAHVIMACRSTDAGEKVAAGLRATLPNNAGTLEVRHLDLADVASAKAFAKAFVGTKQPLDLLLNNAGIMAPPLTMSSLGYESQLATNHLGHMALTVGLMPALSATARVVTVSSALHTRGSGKNLLASLDDDREFKRRSYSGFTAYGDSKLANVLFTRVLAQKLGAGRVAVSLHPGVIATNLSRSMGVSGAIFSFFTKLFSKNPAQGAATSVWGAVAPELASQSGVYLADCHVSTSSRDGQDLALAEKVWALSERAIG